ncbi:MAG TPA: hypothetical protein VHL58_03340, partial [Thermoanaerobaculia bacterium]|nr:hypothetical protein [Thermoanaerobaculia bacterium]
EEALTLLKPFPAEEMRAYPVSSRVNSAKNDGAELVAEVQEQAGEIKLAPDTPAPSEPAEC